MPTVPKLFNILLERIMTYALDQEGTVSIRGRMNSSYVFADAIDELADKEELASLVVRLDKTSASYGMEINAEKTKLVTNNSNGIVTKIKVSGQKLKRVDNCKYLGVLVTDEGSKK